MMDSKRKMDKYAREKIHAYACALVAGGKIHARDIFDEACRLFALIDTLYTEEIQEDDE